LLGRERAVTKDHKKTLLRRIANRVLHALARTVPGSKSLRPALHRWRGVRIGRNVFIGDDVYLENEYPECIEIGDNVEIALRTVILAHLRGPGQVIVKKNAWIGACCLISTASERALTIGEGSVVGAGSIITSNVPDRAFMKPPSSQSVATASIALAVAPSYLTFLRGLRPFRAPTQSNGKHAKSTQEQDPGNPS
jgi:serine acetyltransferase